MKIRSIHDDARFAPEKMQKVNVVNSPHLFVDLYCLEPGQSQKIHRHEDSSKFYLVVDGQAVMHVDGEEQTLVQGQLVGAPVGMDHGVTNESATRTVLLVGIAPPPEHAR